jgi:hypothetical protein
MNPTPAVTPEEKPDRDAGGRFAEGNRGGPGNPFASEVNRFRRRLLQRLTEADMDTAIDKLLELANDGHWPALKQLLGYVIGKPEKFHDWAMWQPEEMWSAGPPPADPPPVEMDLLGDLDPSELRSVKNRPALTDRVLSRPAPSTNGLLTGDASEISIAGEGPPSGPEKGAGKGARKRNDCKTRSGTR